MLASATEVLARILGEVVARDGFAGTLLTIRHPARARDSAATERQLNLYLFHVSPSAERSIATGSAAGSGAATLVLNYLLTPYGRENEEEDAARLLSVALSLVGDDRTLSREQVLPHFDTSAKKIAQVRIRLSALALEEHFRLWAALSVQYRLSVVYDVSITLAASA